MNIGVRFQKWSPIHPTGNRRLLVDWNRNFGNNEIDLALGYIYGLILLRPGSVSITTTYQGSSYKNSDFLHSQIMKSYLLTISGRSWFPTELLNEFLYRNRNRLNKPFTKQYLLIMAEDDAEDETAPTIIIQFDDPTFIQGFLSILSAFRVPSIRHIIGIFDKNGISYAIRN